jgi:hypothetical protein
MYKFEEPKMLDWFPSTWQAAITASAVGSVVLAIIAFVGSTFLKAKIESNIKNQYDINIEELKSSLRRLENATQNEMRAKEDQISALRSGALSGLANRYVLLDKRRIEAIEKVWSHVIHLGRLKLSVAMTKSIKMDYVINIAEKNDEEGRKARDFAGVIWSASGLDKFEPGIPPDTERPFVPPLVWGLFVAYRQIIGHPAAMLSAMRSGVGTKILADPKPMLDLVKAALPHQVDFIDKLGTSSIPYIADELEEKLFSEIQNSLMNPSSYHENIEQAAQILSAVDQIIALKNPMLEVPAELRR